MIFLKSWMLNDYYTVLHNADVDVNNLWSLNDTKNHPTAREEDGDVTMNIHVDAAHVQAAERWKKQLNIH